MKVIRFICLVLAFVSCNSSSKKDPNQAMDDTARMDHPPVNPMPVEIRPEKITAADIPAAIKIKGKVQDAWRWTDSLGENIFVTSAVAPHQVKSESGDEVQSASLHAYHFAKKISADYSRVWVLNEEVNECYLDIVWEFPRGSASVTDLDKDGIAETTVQYSHTCRGDVSPATHTLLMYENGTKYSLLGNTWIPYGPDLKFTVTEKDVNLENSPKPKDGSDEMVWTFGRYENEKEFAGAPPEFLLYARSQWIKHVVEKRE